MHSKDVPVRPVASTVRIWSSNGAPAVDVKFEILTRVPAVKLFTAWKVTTLDVIDSEVIAAAELHPVTQFPNGASRSVFSVSGVLVPVAIVVVPVATSATAPASHMLTYTWLLSADAAVKMRKRVAPGV